MTGPVSRALRAIDAIHPNDPAFAWPLAGGSRRPHHAGAATPSGGQTLYVKLKATW